MQYEYIVPRPFAFTGRIAVVWHFGHIGRGG